MSEFKGTLGEWTIQPFRKDIDKWILIPEAKIRVDYDDVDPAQQEANAQLVIAALDLLAACRMVLDDPGLTASANDVIRSAIAKATGTN